MIDILKESIALYTHDLGRQFKSSMPPTDPYDLVVQQPLEFWGLPNNSFGYFLWIQFHHNKINDPFPIYKKIDDGYLYCTDTTTVYFANNGFIYKLTSTHFDHDWEMHQRLYEAALIKEIEIEVPIEGTKINFLNKTFWYTIVKRNNITDLVDPHQLHAENKVTKDQLITLFDKTFDYCKIIKELDQKYNSGCPNAGCLLVKYMLYPNSTNGIWTDIKHWNSNFNDYIKYTFEEKQHYLMDFKHHNLNDRDKSFLVSHLKNNFSMMGVEL